MGHKLTRRQVLLAKTEVDYGVDPAPTATDDAVMILSGGEVSPDGEKLSDDRLYDTLSKAPHVMGKFVNGYNPRVEFRGGGIDGSAVNPPDFDSLLKACALARTGVVFVAVSGGAGTFTKGETVAGTTSSASGTLIAEVGGGLLLEDVSGTFEDAETLTGASSSATRTASAGPVTGWQYLPQSEPADMESVALKYYRGGHQHTLLGCRGDAKITLPVGQPGAVEFTMRGRYSDPSEQSMPTPTLNDALPPIVSGIGLVVGSYSPEGVNEISLSLGNQLSKDEDVNVADGLRGFLITAREPSGTLDPLADSLDDFNPFAAWKAGTLAACSFLVGSIAGNRIFVDLPRIQYDSPPAYGDREGSMTTNLNFSPKLTVGDDEMRLVFF